jgi:hypothetical protein
LTLKLRITNNVAGQNIALRGNKVRLGVRHRSGEDALGSLGVIKPQQKTRCGPCETIRHPRKALSRKNRPRDQNRDQQQRVKQLRGHSRVQKDRARRPPPSAPRDR